SPDIAGSRIAPKMSCPERWFRQKVYRNASQRLKARLILETGMRRRPRWRARATKSRRTSPGPRAYAASPSPNTKNHARAERLLSSREQRETRSQRLETWLG